MDQDPSLLRAESRVGTISAPPAIVRLAPDAHGVADFLHDESKLAASSIASLATPATLDELREVMTWHAQEGHAVAISGARTGVTGGAVPEMEAHLVSLAALRGVTEVREADGEWTATALAGTSLAELNAYLAANHPGLSFPIDPTETSASLGGMVAPNAAGARSFRFGAIRDWVVGLTVELPSGRTLTLERGRERVRDGELVLEDGDERRRLAVAPIPKPKTKNAIGYGIGADGSAIDLWIGAEGTLGAVSAVTLRLRRSSGRQLGYLQFFEHTASAFRFVELLRGEKSLRTNAIEFLDARSHALARESGKPAVDRVLQIAPPGSCSVFTEVEYADDAELAEIAERLAALAAYAGGNPDASLAGTNEAELRDVRSFRHAVPERINAMIAIRRATQPGLHKLATDMAVPDESLTWVYERYEALLGGEGLDHAVFGHVGDNHFHVNILPRDEGELTRAMRCYAILAREIVARGGAVAAEHGIGRIKKSFLMAQYSEGTLEQMRAIKRWVDPEWRFNRGILIDP